MSAAQRPASPTEFFVTGGYLRADAPSYVSRPADEQLFNLAQAGQFGYVLTTRQMGKSSLMMRTAERLKQQGVRAAIIDLTGGVGMGKSEETWYLDFLTELSDQLGVTQDVEAWWQARATLGPVRRFSNFLRDVVLEECNDPIVIFVDEIDRMLRVPFADDFFTAVRAIYHARAVHPKFNRLTFVLLGATAPADLIQDRTRTPFNIGRGIALRGFDRNDAAVLQQGLEAAYPGQGQAILDRIFYWTAGHPYLTQRLCREVVNAKSATPWTDAAVDRVVNDLLSDQTHSDQDLQQHLQDVQARVRENPQRRNLLKLYGQVRADRPVANDEQSVVQNRLKLAGLVTTDGRYLRVHNNLYRTVFDAAWIKANTLPDTSRVVAYAAVIMVTIVIGLAGFIVWYNSNALLQQAEQLQLQFTQADTAGERLDCLVQLFDLQGILTAVNFDDAARRLFFDMGSRQDQLAIFRVQQDNRVTRVIEGLYTALADVNTSGENDEVLTAMSGTLQTVSVQVPEAQHLYEEINHWLKARQAARQDQADEALAEYANAIAANQDNDNPATHFERARILIRRPSPDYSQAASELDAALAAARKVSEAKPGDAELAATPTVTPTQPATASALPDSTPSPGAPSASPTLLTRTPDAAIAATQSQTPTPRPAPTAPQPPEAAQRPFRSEFISFVQIASAVSRLIESSPGLAAFLANSAESDYGNLRAAQLVKTQLMLVAAHTNESLIIVANFEDRSGGKYQSIDPAQYIYEQLTAQAKQDNLGVRIERLRRTVDDNTVRATGETYSATLVLWGWYDAFTITPYVERIKTQTDSQSTEEGKHLSLADPTKVEFTLITDLPSQSTYLALFVLGLDAYADPAKGYDKALLYFNSAIESLPTNVAVTVNPAEAYRYRGLVYNDKGDYDHAIADYDKAIQLKPDYAEAYNSRGTAYADKGDYDRAIADYDKAIQLQPDYAEAYGNRGNAYANKGDTDRAIADYNKAIQLNPDFAEAYTNRGIAYANKGDTDHAFADYDKAIQLRPDLAKSYFNRGAAYSNYKGDYDRAIADYDQTIQLQPDYAEAYGNRGIAYEHKSDHDRAIADFDKAIQLKPDYADAYNNRCYVLSELGRYSIALPDCEEALKLKPDNPNYLDSRASVYQALGRNQEAIADFRKILELTNDPVLLQDAQDKLKALGVNTPTATPPVAATVTPTCPAGLVWNSVMNRCQQP